MNRKIWAFLTCLILFTFLVSCVRMPPTAEDYEDYLEEILEIPLPIPSEKSVSDSHGGFLGDGLLSVRYRFTPAEAFNLVSSILSNKNWKPLPLPENLGLLLYGGSKDGISYEYRLAQEAGFPEISNGYYFFSDANAAPNDKHDDAGLFDRYSFNIQCALYDSDTLTLYFLSFDT